MLCSKMIQIAILMVSLQQIYRSRKVSELEEKLVAYVGTAPVLHVNGNALELALMAWGIGKGDAVFTLTSHSSHPARLWQFVS